MTHDLQIYFSIFIRNSISGLRHTFSKRTTSCNFLVPFGCWAGEDELESVFSCNKWPK